MVDEALIVIYLLITFAKVHEDHVQRSLYTVSFSSVIFIIYGNWFPLYSVSLRAYLLLFILCVWCVCVCVRETVCMCVRLCVCVCVCVNCLITKLL